MTETGTHVRVLSIVAGAFALALVPATIGSARSPGGVGGAHVMVYYGPTCQKQYGSTNCTSSSATGVQVIVATYPGLQRIASGISDRHGQVTFSNSLPFSLAFFFKGHLHSRLYQGGWRMTNLKPLSGQTIPLDVLLCPSRRTALRSDCASEAEPTRRPSYPNPARRAVRPARRSVRDPSRAG